MLKSIKTNANNIRNTNNKNMSTLSLLRSLTPNRDLEPHENFRLAELQASKLRKHLDLDIPELPTEAIECLPRIKVLLESTLPSSGMSYWGKGNWNVKLNASDTPTRQRFSLLHEFKHIIDHPHRHNLYPNPVGRLSRRQDERNQQLIEQTADYFAACALMPKRLVKTYFFGRSQNINTLAKIFNVSPQAMQFRLNQLGLIELTRRCSSLHFNRYSNRQFTTAV